MKKAFVLIISLFTIIILNIQNTNAGEILGEIPLWWSSKIINYSWEIKPHEFKNEKIKRVYKIIKSYNQEIKNNEKLSVSKRSIITDTFNNIIDNLIYFENWDYREKKIALSKLKKDIKSLKLLLKSDSSDK